MTTSEKIALVRGVRQSVSVGVALSVVDLPRSTWYYQAGRREYEAKHEALKAPLLRIASAFPEYGYRRSTDELSERVGHPVNHKVVQKLARIWGLAALRRPRAPRASAVRQSGCRLNSAGGLKALPKSQLRGGQVRETGCRLSAGIWMSLDIDSWPADVDDGAARRDWGHAPQYDLDRAFRDYLVPTIRGRYS